MELDWSTQSPHIRTLYHPWQPGDGEDEATIEAAEARLGVCLPATLRNFYLAWGKRRDLTFNDFFLLHSDEVGIEANTLFFCADYLGYNAWGVRQEVLEEADPPVVYAYGYWDVEPERNWTPSHTHLSNFLDDMTYCNAFSTKDSLCQALKKKQETCCEPTPKGASTWACKCPPLPRHAVKLLHFP